MADIHRQQSSDRQSGQAGPEDSGAAILVEVAYATPERQLIIPLEVAVGTTALDAVRQSGIVREFPAIDIENDPMGIFSDPLNGKDWPLPADYLLQPKDRVEIYRPLQVDPKQARLARARKKKQSERPDLKDKRHE